MSVLARRSEGLHGGAELVVISVIFTVAALFFVIVRIASRSQLGRPLGPDDFVIIAAIIFSTSLTTTLGVAVHYGYGSPQATVEPKWHITKALELFWVAQHLYKVTITLTKTSILLLYLRLLITPVFRRVAFVVMAFVIGYGTSSFFAGIFQCLPIAKAYDHSITGGGCLNLTAFWFSNAGANIFGDLLIFTLPLPVIGRLNLPKRQRIGLILVFALGGFVCVTSVLRMTTLDLSSKSTDATLGTLKSTIWTTIEPNVGIICACLPMLKSPLSFFLPSLFASPPPPATTPRLTTRGSHLSHAAMRETGLMPGNWTVTGKDSVRLATITGGDRESDEEDFCCANGEIVKRTEMSVTYDDKDSDGNSDSMMDEGMSRNSGTSEDGMVKREKEKERGHVEAWPLPPTWPLPARLSPSSPSPNVPYTNQNTLTPMSSPSLRPSTLLQPYHPWYPSS
ncbi:MAG: hypothetical protein M1827_001528 [Pycnora praestabilis]|nr:MAG: hypothetical protein M1827_001528 [Pycnora praestabilis]